ncbi:hypothetical protein [Variovorax sp. J22R115]|uniref:hypothetical protein n=1 Tax=Variovorax sp. J22R115 TaxID=3053509 RepID=UPI002577101F|nr:hypothetical protein [Variovorax sp. J22R115]MDM0053836.1 hypothetical protein [Variovorax sp. J22R115]
MKTLVSRILPCCILAALAACSNGIDKPLVTAKGTDAYRASLDEAVRDMDKRQIAAFDWAVSNLSIETLNARYPNQSARKIIAGEADAVLKEAPERIAGLEQEMAAWASAAQEISKVTAGDLSFRLEKDFFGLQPIIRTTIHNGSKHGYSTLHWYAELYLDGATKPAASAELIDLYKDQGGLKPGDQQIRDFKVGFVSGEDEWKTIEIQKASQRAAKLVVIPESAQDFGDRLIAGPSPQKTLADLKTNLEVAQQIKRDL